MVKSCAAVNCTNRFNKEKDISFYKFPLKNDSLLKKWLVSIRRENFTPNVHSYICSDHFDEDSFLKGYVNVKKLKDNAVPTIFKFPEQLIQVKSHRPSPRKRRIAQCSNGRESDAEAVPEAPAVDEHNYSLPNSPSKLSAKYAKIVERKENIIKKNSVQVAVLQKKTERQQAKINCMQDLIVRLLEEKLLCEKSHDALENFSDVGQEILRRLQGPKNAEYSNILKSFALTLQFYSPAAYDFVREKLNLCLPHQNTLRKWVNTVDGNPGFTKEALLALKKRIESVTYPVYVALTFDEMSIKKQVDWDGEKFVGYVNYGEGIGVEAVEANEILVMMVVALNCWWKMPIGYFLVRGISAAEKAGLVRNSLQLLDNIGAHCVSITFDGLPANISMASSLGANLNPSQEMKSWFPHPTTGHKVFIILDACHVFKLLRNVFSEKEVLKDPQGNDIKWSYIKSLETLQSNEGLNLGNKLSKRHINYTLQKMKVRLAVQVISRSCATALNYLCHDLKLPQFFGSDATAEFLLTFDHFFDLYNSLNPFATGTKSPMRVSNKQSWIHLIKKVENYALNLKLADGTLVHRSYRKTCVIGIVCLCRSLLGLFTELVESSKLSYLCTYKLSQDAAELFFCQIRSRLGWNNNPTATQFKAAYKRLLVANEVRCKATGNCIPQGSLPLLSWEKDLSEKSVDSLPENGTVSECDVEFRNNDHLYCGDVSLLSEFAKNIVVYIAGYVVKTISQRVKCHTCLETLTTDKATYYGDFINRKNQGGLVLPSENVVQVCKITEKNVRQFVPPNSQALSVGNVQNKILREVLLDSQNCFIELKEHIKESEFPQSHVYSLIKEIAKLYIKIRCHFIAKNHNITLHQRVIRQHLTKSVLFMNQYLFVKCVFEETGN